MNDKIKQRILEIYKAKPGLGYVDMVIALEELRLEGFETQEILDTFNELVRI